MKGKTCITQLGTTTRKSEPVSPKRNMKIVLVCSFLGGAAYFAFTSFRAISTGRDDDRENRSELLRDKNPIYFWASVVSQIVFATFLLGLAAWFVLVGGPNQH